MKEISQLNGTKEWGGTPRQQHKVYDIHCSAPALSAQINSYLILQMYEKG